MPEATPIKTKIPSECFGDAAMVLEFINCFKSLFDLKEYFPKGFTFGKISDCFKSFFRSEGIFSKRIYLAVW